jgi:peptidoglycan glycosyltransferase
MPFEREMGRVLLVILGLLMTVALSAAYWAVVGHVSLLEREDNPRQVLFTQAIQRGTIYDAGGTALAQTIASETGALRRVYPVEAVFGTVGYYSLRYGSGGVEAFYDPLLSGSDQPPALGQVLNERVLHRSRVGTDVRLTLDGAVQAAAAEALGSRRGAVVVLRVPDGHVLAMVSSPAYDPNRLDADWEALTVAEGQPFFNRVLQGSYQAGGTLYTPLMAVMSLVGLDAGAVFEQGDLPIGVDDLTLACAVAPPASRLTLAEAYAYGCPRPFAEVSITLDVPATINALASFQLGRAPAIAGSVATPPTATPTPGPSATPQVTAETSSFVEDVLGQGRLVVNPLGLAHFLSAVVNRGSAPGLRLLEAVRRPGMDAWEPAPDAARPVPLLTRDTAAQVRDWMLNNTALHQLVSEDIGSQVAVSYAGAEAQAWFLGFAEYGSQALVVVVVVENSQDVGRAALVGQAALKAYTADGPASGSP